jgi:hypothetical protein
MRKKDRLEMEEKISEAAWVEDPEQDFVNSLKRKVVEQGSPPIGSFTHRPLSHRPALLILANVIVLLAVIIIMAGPRKVYANIKAFFDIDDPGLQTVEAAGLVTDLEMAPEPTILSSDSSIENISVILNWVYIDEGRLVLGVSMASVPPDLTLGTPTITGHPSLRSDLTFSSNAVEDENASQFIFSAYNPIRADENAREISFGIDVPLIETGDADKDPLAVYHYDLEGVPVHKGRTYETTQSFPAEVNELEFLVKSFKFMPSFTEVEFCTNMSAKEILALRKSDISLRIGEKPPVQDYLVLELAETGDETCVQIGFFDGGESWTDLIIFQFQQFGIAIGERESTPPPPRHLRQKLEDVGLYP